MGSVMGSNSKRQFLANQEYIPQGRQYSQNSLNLNIDTSNLVGSQSQGLLGVGQNMAFESLSVRHNAFTPANMTGENETYLSVGEP